MNLLPLETAQVFIFRFPKTSNNAGAARNFKVPVTLDSI